MQNERVLDILQATGLNWTVSKTELISKSDDEKLNGLKTESFGVYRNDNQKWLGTVSKRYNLFQNYEMAEIICFATESLGYNLGKGGCLSDGQKVFLQVELPNETIGAGLVKRYITCLNSHNGSGSVALGSSNRVVHCQNDFHIIYKELSRFRHNKKITEKIKEAAIDIKKIIELDKMLMNNFKSFTSYDVNDELYFNIFKNAFDIDINKELPKNKINIIDAVNASINKEYSVQGKNVWGLFNGITRFTNHHSVSKKNEEYLMQGAGYKINLITYKEAVENINKNTKNKLEILN